jgi:glycosyltransferase involved in cell wall biosynthesis
MPSSVSALTEKRIIAVARYSHEKGIDLLLEAWVEAEKQCVDWRLDVYGEGDTTPYEHLIDKLGVDRSRCQLNGRTNEIEQEYLKSSIAVCSSRFEGFGMALVEAMACGLPVVAFDCPWGPRSVIHDGEDGVLVENGCPSALSQALVMLMSDTKKLKTMAIAARQHVKRFSIEQVVDFWQQKIFGC